MRQTVNKIKLRKNQRFCLKSAIGRGHLAKDKLEINQAVHECFR